MLNWGIMDMDLGSLLGLASNASGAINNIISAFSGLANLAKDGKLPTDTAGNILVISGQLSEAQVKLAHLETEIVKLQRNQEEFDEIKRRKQNYVLATTAVGERIYRLKEDAGTGEISHEICPVCYEQDRISVLQPRGIVLQCDSCQASYRAKEAPPMQTRARSRWDDF